ncbi:hypothetical protein [Sphingomonas glacialis]|uniref:hypothetical protein n=1 Tax=Sphingomonas glacialis TaxID=658225 RepID=UPI001387029F|nr:hypothetical protein [Sphingomonas glacialis]
MAEPDDRNYFQRRAIREREIAGTCKDKSIASVHKQLADEYEKRAGGETATLKVARDS